MRHRLALLTVLAVSTSTAIAAPAALAQSTSPVVINEVESNGDAVGDWVELANTNTSESVDISGWTIIDGDATHTPITIPEGTSIESGGYYVLHTEPSFGLGGADSVTLSDASGTVIDTVSWTAHAATTLGRLPDMTGDFAETPAPTQGLRNDDATADNPVQTVPYSPAGLTISPVDLGADFTGEDFSGADFDATGRAWVVNNGTGELFALDYDEATKTYTEAGHWTLHYADGTGTPDSEGVAVTDSGIYVATERNNDDKAVSRPSVLRFDLPTGTDGELNAAAEWNLTEFTGELSANGGAEAIEYVPEAGLFAVGIESTGEVLFLNLDGEKAELAQSYASPFAAVASLNYTASTKELRVACDDACDGQSLLMTYDGTEFVTDGTIQARPEGIDNLATEGFASYEGTCETRYLWADDGATLGSGILAASQQTCADTPAGSSTGFFASILAFFKGIGNSLSSFLPQLTALFKGSSL